MEAMHPHTAEITRINLLILNPLSAKARWPPADTESGCRVVSTGINLSTQMALNSFDNALMLDFCQLRENIAYGNKGNNLIS